MSSSRRSSSRNVSSGQHRSRRGPRLRLAVTGAAAIAVLGGGTAFACLGVPGQSSADHTGAHGNFRLGSQAGARGTALPTPIGTPWSTASASAPSKHRPPVVHHSAKPTAAPTSRPTTAAPQPGGTTAPPAGSTSSNSSAVQQVLDLINKNRTAAGLAPYTLYSGLNASAAAHNKVMSSGCGLSHQCPGEAAFGDREIAAGVHWTSAGENIGEAGGIRDDDAAIAASAVGLTQSMLNEKAPNDGHRQNILSSSFTRVGIAVFRDASGTVWMTQDFANNG
ncbi:CAP domain-containing protein [Streptacidiphilus sp. PAMC 29251]